VLPGVFGNAPDSGALPFDGVDNGEEAGGGDEEGCEAGPDAWGVLLLLADMSKGGKLYVVLTERCVCCWKDQRRKGTGGPMVLYTLGHGSHFGSERRSSGK
jgi:hypothetical protein